MDCSTLGLPVHHQLLEFTQTHVHRVGDAIQPSPPLSSPSPPALNLSQHQGLFQWVSSSHQLAVGGGDRAGLQRLSLTYPSTSSRRWLAPLESTSIPAWGEHDGWPDPQTNTLLFEKKKKKPPSNLTHYNTFFRSPPKLTVLKTERKSKASLHCAEPAVFRSQGRPRRPAPSRSLSTVCAQLRSGPPQPPLLTPSAAQSRMASDSKATRGLFKVEPGVEQNLKEQNTHQPQIWTNELTAPLVQKSKDQWTTTSLKLQICR